MKNFTQHICIGLRHTDATGVLFFPEQLKIVLDTFEAFLKVSGISLKDILEKKDFLFPVVHAESDYFAPLTVGNEVEITLSFPHVGTTSFTCYYELTDVERKILVGKVTLVHVVVSAENRKSIPLPEDLKALIS